MWWLTYFSTFFFLEDKMWRAAMHKHLKKPQQSVEPIPTSKEQHLFWKMGSPYHPWSLPLINHVKVTHIITMNPKAYPNQYQWTIMPINPHIALLIRGCRAITLPFKLGLRAHRYCFPHHSSFAASCFLLPLISGDLSIFISSSPLYFYNGFLCSPLTLVWSHPHYLLPRGWPNLRDTLIIPHDYQLLIPHP